MALGQAGRGLSSNGSQQAAGVYPPPTKHTKEATLPPWKRLGPQLSFLVPVTSQPWLPVDNTVPYLDEIHGVLARHHSWLCPPSPILVLLLAMMRTGLQTSLGCLPFPKGLLLLSLTCFSSLRALPNMTWSTRSAYRHILLFPVLLHPNPGPGNSDTLG